MHCLIVTILCCVDDHFTGFVAVLLLLLWFAVNFVVVPKKNSLSLYIRLAMKIGFFSVKNIG